MGLFNGSERLDLGAIHEPVVEVDDGGGRAERQLLGRGGGCGSSRGWLGLGFDWGQACSGSEEAGTGGSQDFAGDLAFGDDLAGTGPGVSVLDDGNRGGGERGCGIHGLRLRGEEAGRGEQQGERQDSEKQGGGGRGRTASGPTASGPTLFFIDQRPFPRSKELFPYSLVDQEGLRTAR